LTDRDTNDEMNGQREAERPRDLDKLRRKRQKESKRKTDSPID
jgi:hypothetical protein